MPWYGTQRGSRLIKSSAVPKLVSFLNCMERTSHAASSLYELPPTPPKEFKPPNRSGYSEGSFSTSTISFLQLSALKLMRIGRLALEKHISHSAWVTPKEKLGLTGQQLGIKHQRRLHSLSNAKQPSTHQRIISYNIAVRNYMSEEGKHHYSLTKKDSLTCIPPSSYLTELNLRPQPLVFDKPLLQKHQKVQKLATSTIPLQDAFTVCVSTYLSYSVASRRSTERIQCRRLTRSAQSPANAQYIQQELHCTILHNRFRPELYLARPTGPHTPGPYNTL